MIERRLLQQKRDTQNKDHATNLESEVVDKSRLPELLRGTSAKYYSFNFTTCILAERTYFDGKIVE